MAFTVQTYTEQGEESRPKAFRAEDLEELESKLEGLSWPDCFGKHVIFDSGIKHPHRFVGSSREAVEKEMIAAAEAANATVVDFIPYETTGKSISVLVLEESHLSVIADKDSARIEMFTCGEASNPIAGVRALGEALGAEDGYVYVLSRGVKEPLASLSDGKFTVRKFDTDEPIEDAVSSRMEKALGSGDWDLSGESFDSKEMVQVISDITGCGDNSNSLTATASFRDRGDSSDPFTRFDTWSIDEHNFPGQGFTSYIIGEERLENTKRSGDLIIGAFHTWPEEMGGLVLADVSVVSNNPLRDSIAAQRKLLRAFGPMGGALHVVRREIF